jgi:type IX secretion system PorP/SprF family membrane protein
MKKNLLYSYCFTFLCKPLLAQQRPQYTQYVFNNFLLNPAVTGIENYTDAKLGYRSQWTGLQGAPVTSYFSINAPIGDNFVQGDATAFPASGGENPSSRLFTQYYRAAEPHHGIGFMIVSDKAGPITQTNIDASYAYHLGITDQLNLAVGVSAGVSHINLNTDMITLETSNDPVFNNINNSQWKPDLGVGALGVLIKVLLRRIGTADIAAEPLYHYRQYCQPKQNRAALFCDRRLYKIFFQMMLPCCHRPC